jgi:twitching motility protein PilT
MDMLLGRLAVHFQVLAKEQVAEAMRWRRDSGSPLDLGTFLVEEGFISAETFTKLERARLQWLEKNAPANGSGAAAPPAAPVQPVRPAPAAPYLGPAEPIFAPSPLVFAEPSGSGFQIDPLPDPIGAPSGSTPVYSPAPDSPATQPVAVGAFAMSAAAGPSEISPSAVAPPAAAAPAPPPRAEKRYRIRYDRSRSLDDLLTQAAKAGASDLHVHSMAPLRLRMNGNMEDCSSEVIEPEHARSLILGILDDGQRAMFEERMQLDFAYTIEGVGRFRANAYQQQRGTDAVFRIIPASAPTLADLGLPANLDRVIQFHQGLVLFTGPAGCGKSSTMAAMTRLVNESRPDHIITVEDPIEYVHPSAACLVNQRQVGPHTESFARALRAALREDPDVIVIGELRDLETISLALTAAETGHLVLGTLHTSSAVRTVNRLLGVFPPEQQAQIRTMVSESLRAVVSQRLLARADGKGRVPAIEVLMGTKAVGNLIRESKTFQIPSQIQTGASAGMVLLDASLMELYKNGVVTVEEARRNAEDPRKFN